MNRETWLGRAVKRLDKKYFAANGYELPEKLAVSCGFPKGSATAIGQCFDPRVSGDATTEIFVSPSLGDAVEVLVTLLHEMIHASVGIKAGHKGPFRKLVKEFGMAGKVTATKADPGTALFDELTVIAGKLGEWPHAAVKTINAKVAKLPTAYRLESVKEPNYTVTITVKRVEEFGLPTDPWGEEMVIARGI